MGIAKKVKDIRDQIISKRAAGDVEKYIPAFSSLEDGNTKRDLELAIRRIYEYIDRQDFKLKEDLKKKIISGEFSPKDVNDFIGIFSQPLVGSGVNDPLLQSILDSFGPQNPNHFFGGPIPSFRAITLADLPAGSSGYNRIQEEGANLAQELIIDFVGAGVTATAGAGKTTVTIPGGGGSSSSFNIFNAWNL